MIIIFFQLCPALLEKKNNGAATYKLLLNKVIEYFVQSIGHFLKIFDFHSKKHYKYCYIINACLSSNRHNTIKPFLMFWLISSINFIEFQNKRNKKNIFCHNFPLFSYWILGINFLTLDFNNCC